MDGYFFLHVGVGKEITENFSFQFYSRSPHNGFFSTANITM
jgi:hypothetical protein